MTLLIDFTIIAVLITGISQFREPLRAKYGNLLAVLALSLAATLILYRYGVVDVRTVIIAILSGAIAGFALARIVNMIQVPAMVAFQHGAGGVAAFLVSLVELTRSTPALNLVSEISGVLGLAIGSLTFSGSMIASAKLANIIGQAPYILRHHNRLVVGNSAVLLIIGVLSLALPASIAPFFFVLEIILGSSFGVLLAIRIGGADMPVLISSLNATAGLAASLCGMIIENQLLIAFGATVAASGSILTYVMCKAMNRTIGKVIFPDYTVQEPDSSKASTELPMVLQTSEDETGKTDITADLHDAVAAMRAAKSVVIVPGFGMALSKAQQDLVALADELTVLNKMVRYAIHPVAGRMPGHMNVLLAEAGVDYDMLVEMETINSDFVSTDLALVVGACDVVNPAALDVEGTPISGMPVLRVHEAQKVVCCNLNHKPGYSGVNNPLYTNDNTVLLTGDAKNNINLLLTALTKETPAPPATVVDRDTPNTPEKAVTTLASAKTVTIIPGYGMALAKAQFKLVELAALLEKRGTKVKYAIHPVAGRMPGHMNVLLAEAEVDYENLLEMDEANTLFGETDVAMIVGACDIVNPAAIERQGTPISGMPILRVQDARHVIVCNFDKRPGYSGVPNPLYDQSRTILLLGDARETTVNLLFALQKIEV